ncbi:MAG TPA: hypothetical protein VEA69_19215 [Tepidisphaeraceae bacterium]|nr:hypothetical protein [Tepidisphaeraceae bacterium]
MEDTRDTQPLTVETLDPIAADLPCAVCSYNLKGQSPAGTCPECGRPVARTLDEDLRLADPAWLRSQAVTMFWLVALALMNYRPAPAFGPFDAWVTAISSIAIGVAAAYACWRLATPDGYDPPDDTTASLLRGLRFAGVAAGTLHAAQSAWFAYRNLNLDDDIGRVSPGFYWLHLAAIVVANWLTGIVLYRFARRLRPANPTLTLHAKIILWALPLSQVGSLGLPGVVNLVLGPSEAAAGAYTLVTWSMSVVFYGFVLLLGRFVEVLRRTAEQAIDAARPVGSAS